ncbi:MAG: hypothetical protein KME46_15790 [Brasilonema angustatum HA4187-MV1]|jgi:hypothetical protein|nr:hypothetical protein [Brasilonema angustatum HA4187-MV1]
MITLTTYGYLCTEVYDITKPIDGKYPDVPYYIKHLSKIGGRILEAMVGRGRLLIPLLEADLNVEGIDSSKDGELIATELQRLPQHWFGRDEFIMCLQENGYKDITLCANYTDGLQPSSHKDTLCFCAALS